MSYVKAVVCKVTILTLSFRMYKKDDFCNTTPTLHLNPIFILQANLSSPQTKKLMEVQWCSLEMPWLLDSGNRL